jgi:hypothetical protein
MPLIICSKLKQVQGKHIKKSMSTYTILKSYEEKVLKKPG